MSVFTNSFVSWKLDCEKEGHTRKKVLELFENQKLMTLVTDFYEAFEPQVTLSFMAFIVGGIFGILQAIFAVYIATKNGFTFFILLFMAFIISVLISITGAYKMYS